jgi:hypothetical protein
LPLILIDFHSSHRFPLISSNDYHSFSSIATRLQAESKLDAALKAGSKPSSASAGPRESPSPPEVESGGENKSLGATLKEKAKKMALRQVACD